MNTKLFINLFLFAVVFGVAMQVLIQTSLAPPMHDAGLVGKHLNKYDVQMRSSNQKKTLLKGHSSAAPTLLRKVVEKSQPVTKDDSKTEEFVRSASAPLDFLKTIEELEQAYGKGSNLDANKARDLYLDVLKDTKAGFNAWLVAHMEAREQTVADNNSANTRKKATSVDSVDDELEHAAVLCSVARSRTRRYVRDRMSDRISAWGLFARDAWKYGAKDLVGAIAKDVTNTVKGLITGEKARAASVRDQRRSKSIVDGMLDTDSDGDENSAGNDANAVSHSGAALASIGACLSAEDNYPCPSLTYMQVVRKKSAKDILNSCFSSNEYYNAWFSTEGRHRAQEAQQESGVAETVKGVCDIVADTVQDNEQP